MQVNLAHDPTLRGTLNRVLIKVREYRAKMTVKGGEKKVNTRFHV